jgi:hypothetical protein
MQPSVASTFRVCFLCDLCVFAVQAFLLLLLPYTKKHQRGSGSSNKLPPFAAAVLTLSRGKWRQLRR